MAVGQLACLAWGLTGNGYIIVVLCEMSLRVVGNCIGPGVKFYPGVCWQTAAPKPPLFRKFIVKVSWPSVVETSFQN